MVPNLLGLNPAQAKERLARDGPNVIPLEPQHTFLMTVWAILKTPMFSLLVAASGLYFLIGSLEDAALLASFIMLSMAITVIQQRKGERAIEALRDLSNPQAVVIRDGATQRIAGSEVVIDDVIVLSEGSRVPADALLLESHHVHQDESLLTGESIPVSKKRGNAVYSGCLITQGSGLARVNAIGGNTQIGQIGKRLKTIEVPESPLQREIRILIVRFALLGLCLAGLVLLMYGLRHHEWLQGALYGISLSMSLLPEEFTVILTVFLALGVLRIAKLGVLTRYPPVIETLGSINVLCVDKTGTLTLNNMQVCALADLKQTRLLEDSEHTVSVEHLEILRTASLASETNPVDPMEKALHESVSQHDAMFWNTFQAFSLIHRYPFHAHLAAMANVWYDPTKTVFTIAAKGSPETIISLCDLSSDQRATIHHQIQELASQGLRLLGVARAYCPNDHKSLPKKIEDYDWEWLGLVGLHDPLRPEVPAAIRTCQAAGIRVVMITGDHALTAQAIAKEAGIASDKILSGQEISQMDEAVLKEAVGKTSIYVRITPEQKLRLVHAFQANHQIVAMTGDGVNDAPALKAAHVGIAMGERGADVAREAASLVLLHDQFAAIVDSISEGRRIYANIRKAVLYVIAIHIPIAGVVFLPIVMGLPPMLTPISLVFLEMMIDPACAIVFEMERAEHNLMHQAPRPMNETIFTLHQMSIALLQGIGLGIVTLTLYLAYLNAGHPIEKAITVGFFTLVLGNIALIIVSRSPTQGLATLLKVSNPAQKWTALIACISLLSIVLTPFLRQRFNLVTVDMPAALLIGSAILISLLWFELAKFVIQKRVYACKTG